MKQNMSVVEIRQHYPCLYLTWVINNICTYACSYCPEDLHTGSNHHYEWKNAKRFVKILMNKYPKIAVSISGGEPTLSPFFKELVKMFFDNGHSVGITTNGVRTTRYYNEVAPYLDYVCMSYHPSFSDENIIEKAKACANHTQTTFRVMMDSRYWDKSLEFYKKIKTVDYVSVEAVRVMDWIPNSEGMDYSERQLKWLANAQYVHADNPNALNYKGLMAGDFYYDDGTVEYEGSANDLISRGENDFRGWDCNIGLESIFVHWNGKVRLANCYQGDDIGNINMPDNIKWPTDSVICTQRYCHCTADVFVSKKKI
jgi:organic radical activating enzyme